MANAHWLIVPTGPDWWTLWRLHDKKRLGKMTRQELTALIQIANRAPKTLAEQLWLQALIDSLQTETPPQGEELE